ncbi:SpvB/TcaC N-terminal domain-containing protein [Lunatibacter salilacus]|uniref:SpvB/TcaC N-terminal domain-containing protein n=1 Tax=Lunatibacter salilacus TaxID=2483804 RepID=UPI00131B2352|nr:SpvB/TcaC N-terminal domain-containing protein [Lunatibacter salilacus]
MNQPNANNEEQKKPVEGIPSLFQEHATESNAIQIPQISLPKGGGALKGIDEKFEVNSANGSAGFSIPLPVSPGRNGFAPALSLSYNSGSGNSPYGLGWSVGYPMIQRKTDKKLPTYRDGLGEDVFMFSGAEDLVPFLEEDGGEWKERAYPNNGADGYVVKRYRPRIEGGFARIEKITHSDHGVYWKVTTRDNVATLFGRSPSARIADPEDDSRIFQWMPEFSYDDKGNWISYVYKEENLDNVPDSIEEKNRLNELAPITNQYLKGIKYGNHKAYYADPGNPYDPQPPVDEDKYFFELVMDYGEHDNGNPKPDDDIPWDYRADAFSSYRSGFEIRTNRLCKRILMFHHFKGEEQFVGTPDKLDFGRDYMVRSLTLDYEESSINGSGQTEGTYPKSVTQTGYIRKPDESYSQKSLPPVEFTYQNLQWNKNIKTVPQEAIVNAPVGLTNNYQWVDLYGEGISGILSEQGEGWYYKSNLGTNGNDGEIAFSVAQQIIPKPSFSGLSNGVLSLQDLAGNGEKQIVVNSPGLQGYFKLTHDLDWQPFKAFEQLANINLRYPNTRMIDLIGDGQPELVVTEENIFVGYGADGKRLHLPAAYVAKAIDEEQRPTIVFADPEQTIFLADMAGDGLTDNILLI